MACPTQVRLLVNKYLRPFLPWSHSLLQPHWVTIDDRTDGKSKPLLFGQNSGLARVASEKCLWWMSRHWRWSRAFCLLFLLGAVMDMLAVWTGDRDGCYDSSRVRICGSWQELREHHTYTPLMEHKGQTNGPPSGNSKSHIIALRYNDLEEL